MSSSISQYELPSNHSPFFTNPTVDLFPESSPLPISLFDVRQTDDHSSTMSEISTSSADPESSFEPLGEKSTRVRQSPSYLRDYHCCPTIVSLHEPSSNKEANTNPLWQ